MQELLNNLPKSSETNPFKIFLWGGNYGGFVFIQSTGAQTNNDIANIGNSYIYLVGEFTNKPIIDMGGERGKFILSNTTLSIENIVFKNFNSTCLDLEKCGGEISGGIPIFTLFDSSIYLKNIETYNSSLINSFGISKISIKGAHLYDSPTFFLEASDDTVGDIRGLAVYQSKNYDYSSKGKLGTVLRDKAFLDIYNSAFVLNNESAYELGFWFKATNSSQLKLTNVFVYGSKSNYHQCILAEDASNIFITNSIVTNCSRALDIVSSNNLGKIYVTTSFIYGNTFNVDPDSMPVSFLLKPVNHNFFDDPEIKFNINDITDVNNFILHKNSIATDSGDPLILDIDGTPSDIGVLGGISVCEFNNYLHFCKSKTSTLVPMHDPTDVLPTILFPTTEEYNYDVNNNGVVDLTDLLLVMRAIFN